MPQKHHSLAWRLTTLFGVVSATLLTAIGILLFHGLERLLEERDNAELAAKLELVRQHVSETSGTSNRSELERRLEDLAVAHPHLSVALFGAGSIPILGSRSFPIPRSAFKHVSKSPQNQRVPQVWSTESGRTYLLLSGSSDLQEANGGTILIAIALDTSGTRGLLARYLGYVLLAIPIATVLAALLGVAVTRLALRPLERVAREAGEISASRLDRRLHADGAPTEVVPLVLAIDEALGRLESSFKNLSNFSSDLAHELRTPVHNLILQSQVALSRGRTTDDYRQVLEGNLDELLRLSRMANDMLFLARADNAQALLRVEPLDLRAELDGVVDFYDAFADERKVTIQCCGAAKVAADKQLLRRAINNLMSNALRHTSPGGTVRATAAPADNGGATLSICNPGPGIAPDHIRRVFDRFYRIDGVRSLEGAGLGLAIVQSIMLLHDGEVDVKSSPEGPTVFELRFSPPRAGPTSARS